MIALCTTFWISAAARGKNQYCLIKISFNTMPVCPNQFEPN